MEKRNNMKEWESHISYKKSAEISKKIVFLSKIITDDLLKRYIPEWIYIIEWGASKDSFENLKKSFVYPVSWDSCAPNIKENIITLLKSIHDIRKEIPPPPTQLWLF
jgi:hypothetical protein